MLQRMAIFIALVALVAVSGVIAINPSSAVDLDKPPVVVPQLGRGHRMFLHHDLKPYSNALSARRPMSDDDAARVLGRTPFLNEAWTALEAGNQHWDEGDYAAALAQWRSVAKKYFGTDAAMAALSHLGQFHRARNQTRDAILAYETLVSQPDPDRKAIKFFLVEDSYKHDACVELSDLLIQTHDLRNALKYADLARTKYTFSSPCGTAAFSTVWALQQRIELLRQAITERRPVRLKTSDD